MLFGVLTFSIALVSYISVTQFYLLHKNREVKQETLDLEKFDADDTYLYFLKVANHNNISLSELCERITLDSKFIKYCVKFNFKNNGKKYSY